MFVGIERVMTVACWRVRVLMSALDSLLAVLFDWNGERLLTIASREDMRDKFLTAWKEKSFVASSKVVLHS